MGNAENRGLPDAGAALAALAEVRGLYTIELAAVMLATTPVALRARCRRNARREGREVVARLGAELKIYEQAAIGDLEKISSLENLEQLELGGRQHKPVTDLPFMSKLRKLKQVKVGYGFLDRASFDRLKAAYPGVLTSD